MPGYHVHIFVTAAGYDREGRILAAGLNADMQQAGSLLFQSDRTHWLLNYDVYYSRIPVEHATFSRSYVYLGKVHEVYGPTPAPLDLPLPPTLPGFFFSRRSKQYASCRE